MLFRIFLKSVNVAEHSASVAEEITAQCLIRIYNLVCKDELCALKYSAHPTEKPD